MQATFTQGGRTRSGTVHAGEVVALSHDTPLPTDMVQLLSLGPERIERVRAAEQTSTVRFPRSGVRLEAPVLNPRKFLGLGGSYKSHLEEVVRLRIGAPKHQVCFNKQVICINGPYDDL